MSNIQIQGLSEVLAKWDKAPQVIEKHLGDAAEALLLGIAKDLAQYPPIPPQSTYRRTGTLGKTWTAARPDITASGAKFEGSIGNSTPYGPWVQASEFQTWYHGKAGWKTDEQAIQEHAQDAKERFDHAIDLIVNEL